MQDYVVRSSTCWRKRDWERERVHAIKESEKFKKKEREKQKFFNSWSMRKQGEKNWKYFWYVWEKIVSRDGYVCICVHAVGEDTNIGERKRKEGKSFYQTPHYAPKN